MRRGLTSPSGLAHYKVRQSGGSTMMKTKALLLGAAIATAVSACATTTSPTGRTQYVGAVSQ